MRRAVLLALPVGAVLAVGGLLWLRRAPEEVRNDVATVSGTVTGRYGTVWNVRITAETEGRLLAETWTNVDGHYSLDVPAVIRLDLSALPIPETYLIPEHRPLALRPGERRVESFDLKTIRGTEGVLEGAGPEPAVSLRAVREGAPSGTEGQGRSAVVSGTRFCFWGLETGAAYGLEVPSLGWALERPVSFRGGDSGIVVPLKRTLAFDVTVREVFTGKDLASFTVKVVKPDGDVFATVEGKEGHLAWQVPHPCPPDTPAGWTLRVGAEGHFEERCPLRGYDYVFLQPARDPNLTLHVRLGDGTPYEGELTVSGTARGGFGAVDARPKRIEAGRYEAVLPAGRWWVTVDPGPEYERPRCDVTVGDRGPVVIDVPPLVRREPEGR